MQYNISLQARRKIAKAISIVAAVTAIIVIIGWIFDIGILKSVSAAWVSMKFDTAVSFLLSGIILYFISKAFEGDFDRAQVVISIASFVLIMLMGTLFFSALMGVHTGTEDIFVKETVMAPMTAAPGRPSVPTMFNFVLIAIAGIVTMLRSSKLKSIFRIIGFIVGAIGISAIAGYSLNLPALYYFVEGLNSAMAIHTAVLFVLLGIGIICLSD